LSLVVSASALIAMNEMNERLVSEIDLLGVEQVMRLTRSLWC